MRTCPLMVSLLISACSAPAALPDAGFIGEVTWYRDVEPIVQVKCAGCHRGGGIGPFALDTYEQAKPMAASMAGSTAARRMPPWMPNADCNSFRDDRRLTAEQIAVFEAWAEQGAVAGDLADARPAPTADAGLEWVDATLTPAGPFTPPAAEPDTFHCFVLDPQLTQARQLVGYEVKPGASRMVHHVLLYSVPRARAQQRDAQVPGIGYPCATGSSFVDGPLVGTWVPGTQAVRFPAGTGLTLDAGDVLVMEMHYNLMNGVETDTTRLELQLARAPVTQARMVTLVDTQFSVPPNAMLYTPPSHPKTMNVPFSGKVWGVMPHMHRRGAKFRYELATGSTNTCLLAIDAWQYTWQETFMFAAPIDVPAGSQARVSCTWNNELDRPLVWGEGTDQEMCVSFAYVTPN